MKKALFFSLFVLFFAGCSTELTFTEIELVNAKKDVRTFFESVEDKNGAHLYFDGDKAVYVMLNGGNVTLGEEAIYFTDFEVSSEGKILNIHYTEEETKDYSGKSFKHQVVYKINKDMEYDTIRSFKNGIEASFEVVSGN